MTRSVPHLTLTATAVIAAALASGRAPAAETLQYNRDIRPILCENCFTCHGPDSAARKAGLRLDKRDAAVQHGAIIPGKPNESEMIRRICSKDADESNAPQGDKESALDGSEGAAGPLDSRGGRLPTALVLHSALAASASPREECQMGAKSDRRLHPRTAGLGRFGARS